MPKAGAWREIDMITSHRKARARKADAKWRVGGYLVIGGDLFVDAVKNIIGDGLITNTIEIDVGIIHIDITGVEAYRCPLGVLRIENDIGGATALLESKIGGRLHGVICRIGDKVGGAGTTNHKRWAGHVEIHRDIARGVSGGNRILAAGNGNIN